MPRGPPEFTPPRVDAKRPCVPGRRATASSGPQKERWASTSIAPTPASVAVSACARAGVAARVAQAVTSAAPASALAKRDVVADADVGGERGDYGAILLEREIDRAPCLCLVRAFARDGEHEVQRRVATRLLFPACTPHVHLEPAQRHALFLEDQHYVRRGAAGGGDEQQLDRRDGDGAVGVDRDGGATGHCRRELLGFAPAQRDLHGVRRHVSSPAAWSDRRTTGCDETHPCRGTRAAS